MAAIMEPQVQRGQTLPSIGRRELVEWRIALVIVVRIPGPVACDESASYVARC
jgi:hypothetical protein